MVGLLAHSARLLAAGPALVGGAMTSAVGVAEQLGRVALAVAEAPSRLAGTAATATQWSRSAVDAVGRQAGPASQALLDLQPGRAHRRVWAGHGQAHIELRGMTGRGQRHRRVAAGVTRRLRGLDGVRWAQINAVTGQVLVSFDEGRVDLPRLLDTVRKVEAAQGTREDDFSWSRPGHPADPAPIAAATVEFAADCVAAATALAGRFVPVPG
jgi:cation-transporting ATPase I